MPMNMFLNGMEEQFMDMKQVVKGLILCILFMKKILLTLRDWKHGLPDRKELGKLRKRKSLVELQYKEELDYKRSLKTMFMNKKILLVILLLALFFRLYKAPDYLLFPNTILSGFQNGSDWGNICCCYYWSFCHMELLFCLFKDVWGKDWFVGQFSLCNLFFY